MWKRTKEATEAVKELPGIAKGVIFIAILAFVIALGSFVIALGTRGMVAHA